MPKRTDVTENNITSIPIRPSTLETIDYAIFSYIKKSLNIHVDTNEGYKRVPVIFQTQERPVMVKDSPEIRDAGYGAHDSLIYPLISIQRSSVNKDVSRRGKYYSPLPQNADGTTGRIEIARTVNQLKTRDRSNADSVRRSASKTDLNKKTFPRESSRIVYDVYSIPAPVYLDIGYQISMRSEYIQQMNQMSSHFMITGGPRNYFIVEHEGHRYEAFVQADFTQENNAASLGTDERLFTSNVTVQVLGYILDQEKIESAIKITQSPAEIIIGRERAVLADEIPFHLDIDTKIRR
jgi:hypothetical protein